MSHTPNGKFQYGSLNPAKCWSCVHIIWAGWTVLGNKYCHFVSIHLEVWGMLGDLADHPLRPTPSLTCFFCYIGTGTQQPKASLWTHIFVLLQSPMQESHHRCYCFIKIFFFYLKLFNLSVWCCLFWMGQNRVVVWCLLINRLWSMTS